jgi:hypothetical protein
MLLRGETAQGHMRAIMVAGPHPLGGEVPHFFNATGGLPLKMSPSVLIIDSSF